MVAGIGPPTLAAQELAERDVLQIKYNLPYSDLTSLGEEDRRRYMEKGEPLEFGHTLSDQIGGQTDAGFAITGFYEDHHSGHALGKYMPTYIATRARKL